MSCVIGPGFVTLCEGADWPSDRIDEGYASRVSCEACRAIAALSIATPGDRCMYCRIAWDLGHEVRCPLNRARFCSICTATNAIAGVELIGRYDERGRFVVECRECIDEHPRSGRYSFGSSRGDSAFKGGTSNGRPGAP